MELLIITGLSGAGKTTALSVLADEGFYCVDNLPFALVGSFISLCEERGRDIQSTAVVIDAREYLLGTVPEESFSELESSGIKYRMIFMDCRDDIIERRYNETRRNHPIKDNITEGIKLERDFLSLMRDKADYILDTSDMRPPELKRELLEIFKLTGEQPFTLALQSFGYKRGVPFETDIVFDMRFVRNPFYEPDLRDFCGLDKPIIDFLEKNKDFTDVLDEIEIYLRRLIPKFVEQGKHRLMVSFGCTGGRHRSVCAADMLYKKLKDSYNTSITHRDLNK